LCGSPAVYKFQRTLQVLKKQEASKNRLTKGAGMDYNLGSKKNCLIGNWSEELSLNEYAGHYRMPHDGVKGTSSYKRVFEHELRYEVADLVTTNRKDFNQPTALHQNLTYKPNAMRGAREQLMMQKMQSSAVQKAAPVEAEREWATVAQESYVWPEVDEHYASTLGSKKMRSLDNGPIPGRDRTFVLEHGIVQPHLCLETEAGKTEESPLMEQDIPITLYSHKPDIHPMSLPTGTNPFGKDSFFSMPIAHYNNTAVKDL